MHQLGGLGRGPGTKVLPFYQGSAEAPVQYSRAQA